LARTARERRHIRNNLPLKDVIVVAANDRDVEALQYLKSYFMGEINAWNVTLSTDWVKLCVLKVIPDFGKLGKRLGKQMKEVQKAINELTQDQAAAFMESGSMTVCGFELGKEDLVVKRDFSGDTKRYEACVSSDGSLLVAIDTTCDEEVLQELRARSLAAAVQKLRKSGGLVVSDRVEIFYEEKDSKNTPIAKAVKAHSVTTQARLKSLPLPMTYMPPNHVVMAEEIVKDADISKAPFRLVLSAPAIAVDLAALTCFAPSGMEISAVNALMQSLVMYLQTLDYEKAVASEHIKISVDGVQFELKRGVHYYASAQELCKAKGDL
jgi:isoleucyl-tRNA synthetase